MCYLAPDIQILGDSLTCLVPPAFRSVVTSHLRSPKFDHPPFQFHPLVTKDDASGSFRLIRVCSYALLLPRLVLDNPGSVHCDRDERPGHPSGSYTPADHHNTLRLMSLLSDCSFRGGCWCRSGLIRWHPSDGGCGRSGIVLRRIRN